MNPPNATDSQIAGTEHSLIKNKDPARKHEGKPRYYNSLKLELISLTLEVSVPV